MDCTPERIPTGMSGSRCCIALIRLRKSGVISLRANKPLHIRVKPHTTSTGLVAPLTSSKPLQGYSTNLLPSPNSFPVSSLHFLR